MAVAGDRTYLAGNLVAVVEADAIIALSDAGVTSRLVRQYRNPYGQTISFPKFNLGTNVMTSADAGSVTDGTEVDATLLNSEKVTITPSKLAIRSDIYDDTYDSSVGELAGTTGQLLGNAMAAKWDNLLNALFDGFTTNAIGTSTAGMTIDLFFDAYKSIQASRGAQGPVYGVLPAGAIWGTYGILNDVVNTTQYATDVQAQGLREAWVDRIAGVNVFKSNEFTETSNATKSGIFVRDALAIGWAGANANQGFKIERERHATYTRDVWVISSFVGVIEAADVYGVELHTRTSAP